MATEFVKICPRHQTGAQSDLTPAQRVHLSHVTIAL
jgi:hypothetical protein